MRSLYLLLLALLTVVECRIREEELITLTTNSATITWVTTLPVESQVIYAPCDNVTIELQKEQAKNWETTWKTLINSSSKMLDRFSGILSSTPNTLNPEELQKVLEQFILDNHAWFARHLTDKASLETDEPDLHGHPLVSSFLMGKGQFKSSKEPTQFHHVTIDGLTPGSTYCYQVLEGGNTGSPTPWSPGYLTTLVPPPGERLFTFATLNDMHVGEKVAGLVVIGGVVLTPGFQWDDPNNPYWKFTNEAAVHEVNLLNADFTIAKGDVSSDFKEQEYLDCKAILDQLVNPYYVMRGNHDRVEQGPDYYKLVFNITTTWYSFDYQGFHFLALDSVNLDNGSPEINDEEFSFLENDLATHNETKTFVFLHHTATLESFVYSLIPPHRIRFLEILKRSPQVVGVFSGHSHRAAITGDRDLPDLVFAETPAVKEYPMGFSIYEVYSTGYIQHFHRTTCAECLEWNSMTRQEYFRLAPFLQYGTTQERNFVVNF